MLFAASYVYIDGMLEKRDPFRAANFKEINRMNEQGKVALGGAFNDPCDGAVILFHSTTCTKQEVIEFAKVDPYVTAGLVTQWSVSEYMAVVGSLKPE